jgi:hypothetical protein
MTQRTTYPFLMIVGIGLAAHAVYWFISGRNADASDVRTAAVFGQIVVGLALATWAWRRAASAAGPDE